MVTRREFLKAAGGVGGALGAGVIAATEMAALASTARSRVPHIAFPAEARERVSVASYPFRAYIASRPDRARDSREKKMDLAGFAREVVEKFGVRNIEPYSPHIASLEPAYLSELRDEIAKRGVKIVNIAVSMRASYYDADDGARAAAVAEAKKWVDAAVTLGAPSIRTSIRESKNSAPNAERTAGSLREVAEYGAAKNVVVNLENDDPVSEDAFFVVRVIEAVGNPYLRALPDFANSMLKGDAEFDYRAVTAMFGRAYSICHVKDGEADEGREYRIDLKRTFGILKASGFRGYCSMEYDAPGEPYGPTTKLIEETVKYLA